MKYFLFFKTVAKTLLETVNFNSKGGLYFVFFMFFPHKAELTLL